MKLTQHFTVEEFTASDSAARHGIDNTMPSSMMQAAVETCELLERIRLHLQSVRTSPLPFPIILTSGYRCHELNTLIGGSTNSDHLFAWAADFKAPGYGSPYDVCRALWPAVDTLGIGQLIHEFGAWVHVSTRRPAKDTNRVITYVRKGQPPQPGIVRVP